MQFSRLWSLVRRTRSHARLAVVILTLGLGLAAVVTFKTVPAYRAECAITVKTREGRSPMNELRAQMTTRVRLEAQIRALGLYPDTVRTDGMLAAVDEMRAHVTLEQKDAAGMLRVSFEYRDRELAREATQRMVDGTLEEVSTADLEAARAQVAVYELDEKRLATAALDAAALASARSVAQVAPTRVAPRQEDAALMAKAARITREIALLDSSPDGAPQVDPVIAALRAEKAAATATALQQRSEKEDLKRTLTPDHPDMRRAQAQSAAADAHLVEVDARLTLALSRSADPVRPSEGGSSPASATALRRELAEIHAQLGLTASASTPVSTRAAAPNPELERLTRAAVDAQATHAERVKQLRTAQLFLGSLIASGPSAHVLEPAFVALRAVHGDRTRTGTLGALAALLCALVYVAGRVAIDDTITEEADVGGLLPILGVVPHVASTNNLGDFLDADALRLLPVLGMMPRLGSSSRDSHPSER